MDVLMESGFLHWMSERMSFTNWVKADFHETSRITLKFSAPPREISARRGEFALRQLLFLGYDNGKILKADCGFGLDDSKSSVALLLRCSDAEVGQDRDSGVD